jgi:hypothetical protein
MAFDEYVRAQLGLLAGFATTTLNRMRDAANDARQSSFTFDDLFEYWRQQLVDNWDTWNQAMILPLQDRLPTVIVAGKWDDLNGKAKGTVTVHRRLTGATFNKVPLERTTGGNQIAPADYSIDVVGDFDGQAQVTMQADIPAGSKPTGGVDDVYVGPLLAQLTGDATFRPIAWIAVVVEP